MQQQMVLPMPGVMAQPQWQQQWYPPQYGGIQYTQPPTPMLPMPTPSPVSGQPLHLPMPTPQHATSWTHMLSAQQQGQYGNTPQAGAVTLPLPQPQPNQVCVFSFLPVAAFILCVAGLLCGKHFPRFVSRRHSFPLNHVHVWSVYTSCVCHTPSSSCLSTHGAFLCSLSATF